MNARRIWLAVVVAGLCMLSPALGKDEETVAKFGAMSKGNAAGHQAYMIIALGVNGKQLSLVVPNEDDRKPMPVPKAEVYDVAKGLKSGDWIKVSYDSMPPLLVIKTLETYTLKPGEDTPNGYVFRGAADKEVGKAKNTYVTVTKFGQEMVFAIATRKIEKGGTEPEPELQTAANNFKEGDAVWIQLQGKTVTAIEPYTQPLTGKVVKVSETEVDDHKTPSAEVDQEGKTLTLLVPGKLNGKIWTPDPKLAGEVKKLKPGAAIQFRTHEEGDKVWVREIGLAPKGPPAPKAPAVGAKDKEMAKENAKDKK
ncbi:MAG: hypothetical protein JWP03_877 [Phycisphaerales bacterium]|jgi:hypothetical protein|nr:hypothetical protein [Phycisphaerales bacterium]